MAYTVEQVARLKEHESISYLEAEALGKELGYSTRSVIAKVKSLEIPYTPKEVAPKKEPAPTKAELVEAIEAITDYKLEGLVGATAASLTALYEYFTQPAV